MATYVIHNSGIRSAHEANQTSNTVWAFLTLMLLLALLLIPYIVGDQTDSQSITEHPARLSASATAKLIPILSGGAGGATSLGGAPSLGGDSHH